MAASLMANTSSFCGTQVAPAKARVVSRAAVPRIQAASQYVDELIQTAASVFCLPIALRVCDVSTCILWSGVYP
jgi:hypothetical protein